MKKKQILSIFILVFLIMCRPIAAYADSTPYESYIQLAGTDDYGRSQNLYEPVHVFNEEIKKPEDIFYYNKKIYVADSTAGAILIFDEKGDFIQKIGEDTLSQPTGVFVTEEYIYVADYGSLLVFQFEHNGELIHTYDKPDSPLYGKNESFRPTKLAADISNSIYIVSEGGTNGIVQINETGEFLGYFGVNSTSVSFKVMIQKLIFTASQKEKLAKIKPPSPIAIAIDRNGIIYTGTNEASYGERLKKLNVSGKNVLSNSFSPSDIIDLTVDTDGNIFVVTNWSEIWIYDSTGNLLGVLAVIDASQERLGAFKQPSGICIGENHVLYVTDKSNSSVTILKPTEMAEMMFRGVSLYKEGRYIESMNIWQEVLTLNSNISLAHKAMGKAYFKQKDYDDSLFEFKLSADTKGYSEAFWELRNDWLMNYLSYVIVVLFIIFIIKKLLDFMDEKKKIYDPLRKLQLSFKNTRIYRELRTPFYIIRHPIDLCDYVKRLKKVSWAGILIIFLWFVVSKVLAKYCQGFVFTGSSNTQINVVVEVLLLLIPFVAFILSNYLVSTITDGEGSFKNVVIVSTLSFSPYFLFNVPLSLLTNVLTLNEAFIFSFGQFFILGWSFLLLFSVIKEIHDYSFAKAIKNMLLTAFGMVILLLVIFITYVLADQVIKFIINFR